MQSVLSVFSRLFQASAQASNIVTTYEGDRGSGGWAVDFHPTLGREDY
jgi:hypothetical protein